MLALWFRCENKSMLRSSSCLKYCLGPRGERVGWVLSEQIYLRVANPFAPTKKTTNGRLFSFNTIRYAEQTTYVVCFCFVSIPVCKHPLLPQYQKAFGLALYIA